MKLILLVGIFLVGCSAPSLKVYQAQPKSDCEWVLRQCKAGKRNNDYTKEYCQEQYDDCEFEQE